MGPVRSWLDLWAIGAANLESSLKLAELAQSSAEVVERRSRLMLRAWGDPANADYTEFARMISEKGAAFWEAGAASAGDIGAWQVAAVRQWQQLAHLALSGGLPSAGAIEAITGRSVRLARHATVAGGKALRPVHRRATANARRLKKER